MSQPSDRAACPDEETIVLFLSGSLRADAEARVREHVNGCPACRALLADAARTGGSAPRPVRQPSGLREPSAVRSQLEGKYELGEELGSGGMGRVFLGRHIALDRRVAIKVVHPELVSDSTVVRRFEREARAAAALHSRHAVQILDIDWLASGAPFIVMEYLEGFDLAELMRRRTTLLPLADAVRYVLEACDAIAEAHGRGIIHRDLKPQNLFLAEVDEGEPIVKVLDFGLAKILPGRGSANSSDTMTAGGVLGTPHFMSPEQIRSLPDLDQRTDIWSIGATLFQLVSGNPPFTAANFHLLRARMLREDAPLLSSLRADVPPELDEIVRKSLQRRPEDRWQSIEAFAAALASLPTVFAGPPPTERVEFKGNTMLDVTQQTVLDPASSDLTLLRGSPGGSGGAGEAEPMPSTESVPITVPLPDPGEGPKTRRR